MSQHSQVFRSMIFSYPAIVFPKSHIQYSVETVLNTPMPSNGFENLFCW